VEAIAWSIVAEAKRLIDHDTIRVYRVDHDTGWCEPIAFEGSFLGAPQPARARRLPGCWLRPAPAPPSARWLPDLPETDRPERLRPG
jgi:hypothetical protein